MTIKDPHPGFDHIDSMQSDFPLRKKNVDLIQQTAPAELFLIVPIYLPQAAIPYLSHTFPCPLGSR